MLSELSMPSIHRILGYSSLIVGGLFNVMLFYCIQRKRVREIKIYKVILMQTCIVDLLFLALNATIQPILCVDGDYYIMYLNNFFRNIQSPYSHFMLLLWFAGFYASFYGMAIQFVFRYYVICKNLSISTQALYLRIVFVAFACILIDLVVLYVAGYPETGRLPATAFLIAAFPQYFSIKTPISLYADQYSLKWILHLVQVHIFFLGTYAIIVYTGRKMWKFIYEAYQDSTIVYNSSINRQVTLNLIIQSCLPLIVLGAIGLAFNLPHYTDDKLLILHVESFIFPAFNIVPIINPLITLIAVRPYRKFYLRFLSNSAQISVAETMFPRPSFLSSATNKPNKRKTLNFSTNLTNLPTS